MSADAEITFRAIRAEIARLSYNAVNDFLAITPREGP